MRSHPKTSSTASPELIGQFGEQLRVRGEEFVKLSTQAQGTFKQFVVESTAKVDEAMGEGRSRRPPESTD